MSTTVSSFLKTRINPKSVKFPAFSLMIRESDVERAVRIRLRHPPRSLPLFVFSAEDSKLVRLLPHFLRSEGTGEVQFRPSADLILDSLYRESSRCPFHYRPRKSLHKDIAFQRQTNALRQYSRNHRQVRVSAYFGATSRNWLQSRVRYTELAGPFRAIR
jgi:hypothetical protein